MAKSNRGKRSPDSEISKHLEDDVTCGSEGHPEGQIGATSGGGDMKPDSSVEITDRMNQSLSIGSSASSEDIGKSEHTADDVTSFCNSLVAPLRKLNEHNQLVCKSEILAILVKLQPAPENQDEPVSPSNDVPRQRGMNDLSTSVGVEEKSGSNAEKCPQDVNNELDTIQKERDPTVASISAKVNKLTIDSAATSSPIPVDLAAPSPPIQGQKKERVTQPEVAVALIKSVVAEMSSGKTQGDAIEDCDTNRNTVVRSKFIYYMDAINPDLLQQLINQWRSANAVGLSSLNNTCKARLDQEEIDQAEADGKLKQFGRDTPKKK